MTMTTSRRSTRTKPRRILGLDPGLGRFGWAVLETKTTPTLIAAGCITTRSGTPNDQRLVAIFSQLKNIMQEFQPGSVALEELFFSKNVSTAMVVGQARGVALLAAAQEKIAVVEYSPTTIKASVTGYGRADKLQISHMILRLLNIKTKPRYDDTVDAMAIAWCGTQSLPRP